MNARAVSVRGSLRRRLILTLIGGAALLALLVYVAVRAFALQLAVQSQDRILEASATAILDSAVVRGGRLELDLPYAALSMLDTAEDDRVFYAIEADGAVLSGYDGLTTDGSGFDTIRFLGAEARRVQVVTDLANGAQRLTLRVAVAQTRDSLAGTLRRVGWTAAALGLGFFGLAVGLSLWAASLTVGPLARLARSVARRGPADLSPVTRPVPVELAPLVGDLNQLMARLERALAQSEEFIAEAAHRVRTPLATVRSHAETTLQRVDKDENRAALRTMMRALDESSRAAGQLLDHAMVTFRRDHLTTRPVDLGALAREMCARLTPIADLRDVTLEVRAHEAATLDGDPILLQNALRNLIENALKFAPPFSTITLEAGPGARLAVLDQGPGFPAGDTAHLVERFRRGANAGQTIGSGLGLTIVRDVAEAHGGQLVLANTAKGGACASLVFMS